MKKAIFIYLNVISVAGFSQNKIGNLSIESHVFSQYLLHLYSNPDTVELRTMDFYEPIHWNEDHTSGFSDPIRADDHERHEQMLFDYNEGIKKAAISSIKDCEYCKRKYLVIRKPTEDDFIKWYVLNQLEK